MDSSKDKDDMLNLEQSHEGKMNWFVIEVRKSGYVRELEDENKQMEIDVEVEGTELEIMYTTSDWEDCTDDVQIQDKMQRKVVGIDDSEPKKSGIDKIRVRARGGTKGRKRKTYWKRKKEE